MSAMDILSYNHPPPPHSSFSSAALPQRYPYQRSVSSSASSSCSSIFSADCPSSSRGSVLSFSSSSVEGNWETGCAAELQALAAATANTVATQLENRSSGNSSTKACGLAKSGSRSINEVPVPPQLRQNPRRTRSISGDGSSGAACTQQPPSLVRQCERKLNFVDSLVDSAAQIVETIWPLSVAHRSDAVGCKNVLPLRIFIQETLRRSRTSYSTLQVSLYYLILIKNRLPKLDFTMEQTREPACLRAMQCGRRMFLAALILASKYLQDRNYSARAWSKISGLSTSEINQNELAFLEAVEWKLHISEPVFQRWTDIVLKYTPHPGDASNGEGLRWGAIIPLLTPELNTISVKHSYRRHQSPPQSDMFGSPSPCQTPVPECTTSAANDQTPTDSRHQIPSTLEPNPQIDYVDVQLPSLPKLGLLPTPQMTPQPNLASTPAVGVNGFDQQQHSRRPSIGAALLRAKSMSVQRSTLDQRPPSMYISRTHSFDSYSQSRRSSLGRSTTSSQASSPESMISDAPSLNSSQSSRSSRSSSVSSITSGTCAPFQPRVAGRSIRRCANLPTNCLKESKKSLCIATPIDEACYSDICASPETLSYGATSMPSIPDLSNFNLGTPSPASNVAAAPVTSSNAAAQEAAQGLCELSGALPRSHPAIPRTTSSNSSSSLRSCESASSSPARRCRKRGRSNTTADETSLHQNVRHLMTLSMTNGSGSSNHHPKEDDDFNNAVVLPDNDVADSFLLSSHAATAAMKLPLRLALPTHPGSMKRACCGKDAANFLWGMRRNMAEELD